MSETMSSTPSMKSYIDSLPLGLDSYPDYAIKGAVFRQFVEIFVDRTVREALPPKLRSLLDDPPPVSSWLPEIQLYAIMLASMDLRFKSEAGFVAAAYDANVALLRSPIYRVLMFVMSPMALIRGAATRWSGMHRGLSLVATVKDEHAVSLRMTYPANLLPRPVALAYGTAFRSAVEAAGGKHVRLDLARHSATLAEYEASWL